jgi:hypothetical protein
MVQISVDSETIKKLVYFSRVVIFWGTQYGITTSVPNFKPY